MPTWARTWWRAPHPCASPPASTSPTDGQSSSSPARSTSGSARPIADGSTSRSTSHVSPGARRRSASRPRPPGRARRPASSLSGAVPSSTTTPRHTPRLDQLAADGVRFAAAFTSGPMTLPSVGQIFTSSPFPAPTRPTLVSSLFAGGVVRTKAIVNNLYLFHWLALATRDPFDSITEAWSWRADRISRNALQWIDQRPGEPFALYLHYIDTHTPYRPPPPFATRFTDATYQGPVGLRFDDVAG